MDFVMDMVFKRLLNWVTGTDGQQRIRLTIVGIVAAIVTKAIGFLSAYVLNHYGIDLGASLTPDKIQALCDWLDNIIVGAVLSMIAAWSHRQPTVTANPPVAPQNPPSPPVIPKAAAILLALTLLGGRLRALDAPVAGWCAGPSLWGGSAIWQANGASALVPRASTLGGVQFTGYLGDWEGETFNPTYYLGILGGMDTEGGKQQPAVGMTAGYNGAGLFAAKLLGPDSGGLIFGVEGSLQFSGYVPFLYLGKPGN